MCAFMPRMLFSGREHTVHRYCDSSVVCGGGFKIAWCSFASNGTFLQTSSSCAQQHSAICISASQSTPQFIKSLNFD